ncbi:MAG: putative Ig domain-containing protein [Candidatus Micrarchaeota archaeon]|nr:putative Ig domain-containing protein [Candidatus Micrarchaeota archaeon]
MKKAPEKSTGLPASQPGGALGRLIDRSSFFSGMISGIIVIGILLIFIYLSTQPPQVVSVARNESGEKPVPSGLEVVVKNTGNQTIIVRGGEGSSFPNQTKELKPGETATVDFVAGGECDLSSPICWKSIVVNYLFPGGGTLIGGGSAGGNEKKEGELPPSFESNQSGGEGGGERGGEPAQNETPRLKIITSALPAATQDAKYSFQLEAEGGVGASYGWAASGLPRGLTMSHNGMIFGAPLEKGTFGVDIVVYDGYYSTYKRFELVVR